LREASDPRGKPYGELFAEILAGIERWKGSELWHAGKVHWLGNWLSEGLWAEDPLAAGQAPKSRAGPLSKREQGLVDFRRRMEREVEERGENARFIHRAGSG
jgi:hypothetical protein